MESRRSKVHILILRREKERYVKRSLGDATEESNAFEFLIKQKYKRFSWTSSVLTTVTSLQSGRSGNFRFRSSVNFFPTCIEDVTLYILHQWQGLVIETSFLVQD